LQGKIYVEKVKPPTTLTKEINKTSAGGPCFLALGGGDGGGGLWSGSMSGGKPVFVSVMYATNALMRWGSDQIVASCLREETSFNRSSRTREWAGQVRMACWKDSGPVSHHGQVGSGSSSNHEGWAAK